MDLLSRINEIRKVNGRWQVVFDVESTGQILQDMYEAYRGKDLVLKVHAKREKRSLDANAYYWKMLSQLAAKLGNGNSKQHNLLLREYSEVETIDGKVIELEIIESEKAYNEVTESSMHHLLPTSQLVIRDGEVYRVYQMVKGSSQMNTKQMARLIDGLISCCREQGIPTITDEEAERLIEAYGKRV